MAQLEWNDSYSAGLGELDDDVFSRFEAIAMPMECAEYSRLGFGLRRKVLMDGAQIARHTPSSEGRAKGGSGSCHRGWLYTRFG